MSALFQNRDTTLSSIYCYIKTVILHYSSEKLPSELTERGVEEPDEIEL